LRYAIQNFRPCSYRMYLAHFGLTELPFGLTPDTAFVFSARAHQEALNTLLLAVNSGEGFMKITGEVGTGKTLLCRRFLASLDKQFVTAYLPNPYLDPQTLFLALAEELGQPLPANIQRYHLLKQLNQSLLAYAASEKRVIVCLDEAQALPLESLEALRLLSNFETEKRKLLQVVMFGQPELDDKLADPSVRQLRQRIAFHYRLSGLDRRELEHYLNHRLRVAGYRGSSLFSHAALTRIQQASGGTPRLINILAHKALLAVFGEGGIVVLARHVRAAAHDTESAQSLRRSLLGWFAR
jgi:MSHA biogenesis protein MshM